MQRWCLVDTINFYRDNFSNFKFLGLFFFGFGLPFHCCTFPDFFRQLIGTWLTKIKLVKKLYQFKNNFQVHKQFVPWVKLNYKIYTSTAAYTCWTMSLLPLMTSTFSTLIWQGLKKKTWIPVCPFSKQFSHVASSHFLLVLVNNFVRGWLAYTLAHWVSEL